MDGTSSDRTRGADSVAATLGVHGTTALAHRLADLTIGASSTSSPNRKSSGDGKNGNFDESKIKRDGRGRFARKNSRNRDDPRDEEWLSESAQSELEDQIRGENLEATMNIIVDVAKKYGLKTFGDAETASKDTLDKANSEAMSKVASYLNGTAGDKLVSPSGSQKMEFYSNGQEVKTRVKSVRARHFDEDVVDNVLAHYGIKGMKWGVRRTDAQLARAAKKAEPSEDFKVAATAKAKPSYALSNQEMQALITRLDLEQRYSRLVNQAPPPSRTQKAKKFVTDLMVDIGREQVTRVAKGAATQRVNQEASKRGLDLSGGKKKKNK